MAECSQLARCGSSWAFSKHKKAAPKDGKQAYGESGFDNVVQYNGRLRIVVRCAATCVLNADTGGRCVDSNSGGADASGGVLVIVRRADLRALPVRDGDLPVRV